MSRYIRFAVVVMLLLVVAIPFARTNAELTNVTVGVAPSSVAYGATLDITFTVDFDTIPNDQEFMERFDVTLPNQWAINSVTPSASDSTAWCAGGSTEGISGQVAYWQTTCGLGTWSGVWGMDDGPHDFIVNVTVGSCTGAPWTIPWNVNGDEYGNPPHDASGAVQVSATGCPVTPPAEDEEAAEPEPVPGCDVTITVPSTAVGATITAETPVYFKPGGMSDEVFPAGLNLLAIGVDSSGMYTKVLYVCGTYWVPTSVIGPNYEAPWNGAPLPAGVVE